MRRLEPLVLAAAVVVSFGVLAPWTGFYCDDWQLFKPLILSGATSLPRLVAAFNPSDFWYLRPGDMVYHPFVYWLFGLHPLGYQLLYLSCDVAAAVLTWRALERASGERRLSFLTALLFGIYPNHAATHHWFAATATPAIALTAFSFERFAAWLETRRPVYLIFAWLLFAAGALTYEAALPLVLVFPFLAFIKGRRISASWTLGAVAAFVMVYHVGIARLFPHTLSRAMMFDPGYAARTMGKGIECAFTGILALGWKLGRAAPGDLPLALWLPGGAGLLAVGALAALALDDRPAQGRRAALWAAAGLAITAACYLPFCVSADRYVPHVFDEQNRLNAMASLGAAMTLAAGLSLLRRPALVKSLGAVLLLFTVINWRAGWDWKLSWDAEKSVLEPLMRKVSVIQGPATIVVDGPPHSIGGSPVLGGWSVDAALTCLTRRPDLHAGMPDEPYDDPARPPRWIYDAKTQTLAPAPGPVAAR